MAGEMYVAGLSNTGFDYDAYLQKLAELKSIPIQNLQAKQQEIVAKQTAIVDIKSILSGFLSPLTTLQDSSIYTKLKGTLSKDIGTLTIDSTKAQPGSYDIEVTALAKASSFLVSPASTITDPTATLPDSGTLSIVYKKDGAAQTLAIDYSGKSLVDVAQAINGSNDLKASIINTGSTSSPNYKLMITSRATGVANEITGISDSDGDDTKGFDTSPSASYTTQSAQDAQLTLNGIPFTSSSNTFTNLLDGVDLTAKELGTATLSISKDYSQITSSIDTILQSYNKLKDTINQVTAKGQPLSGEASLNSITRTIFDKLTQAFGKYGIIEAIGEGENATGYLKLNEEKLNNLLEEPTFDAKKVFEDFSSDLEKYVNNYMDNMSLTNNMYIERNNRLQKEIDLKTERLQKELESLRLRYAKVDLFISQLKSTQLDIQNFSQSLLGGKDN